MAESAEGPRWVRGGGSRGTRGGATVWKGVCRRSGCGGVRGGLWRNPEGPRWVRGGDPRGSHGLESTFSWGVTTLIVASWGSPGLVVSGDTVVAGSAAPFWYRHAVASRCCAFRPNSRALLMFWRRYIWMSVMEPVVYRRLTARPLSSSVIQRALLSAISSPPSATVRAASSMYAVSVVLLGSSLKSLIEVPSRVFSRTGR